MCISIESYHHELILRKYAIKGVTLYGNTLISLSTSPYKSNSILLNGDVGLVRKLREHETGGPSGREA